MFSDTELADQDHISPEALELQALKEELLLFASLINHDFKEPIRTISAFSSLLGQRLKEEDEKSLELLGFVQDGASRMNLMVEGLVEYLRVERYLEKPTTVDLNVVLPGLVHHFKTKLQKANATLTWDDLPTVEAASSATKTVFKHIIGNALNFQTTDVKTSIHVSAKEDKQGITLKIKDNGIGIPPAMTEQIFKPFRRLNAIGTYKGCGLGLAVCHKIMSLQGGKTWSVAPEEGGLEIFLFFPKKG